MKVRVVLISSEEHVQGDGRFVDYSYWTRRVVADDKALVEDGRYVLVPVIDARQPDPSTEED